MADNRAYRDSVSSMGMGKSRGFGLFRALAVATIVAVPASVFAHARLIDPKPRTPDDALKGAGFFPCGQKLPGKVKHSYQKGENITVTFEETIDHQGCFQIALSKGNDQNFVKLKQINDEAGTPTPGKYEQTVQLPADVECDACALGVWQLMNGAPCAANQNPEVTSTYFSCADICIGANCPPNPIVDDEDAGADDGGSSGSSGGPTTVPTDGGGKTTTPGSSGGSSPRGSLPSNDGGCSIGWGGASGLSLVFSAGLAAAMVARRRRSRSKH